jgi:hypothetical protein
MSLLISLSFLIDFFGFDVIFRVELFEQIVLRFNKFFGKDFIKDFQDHSSKNHGNTQPLQMSNCMPKNNDTADNGDNFPRGRYQRKDMLLKIGDNVVNSQLSSDLEYIDKEKFFQALRMFDDESYRL